MIITQTQREYRLKDGTKTAFESVGEPCVKVVDELSYRNFVEAAPFFRRLGGSEYQERAHTVWGYRVVRNISKSPDRKIKKITEWDFQWRNQ